MKEACKSRQDGACVLGGFIEGYLWAVDLGFIDVTEPKMFQYLTRLTGMVVKSHCDPSCGNVTTELNMAFEAISKDVDII